MHSVNIFNNSVSLLYKKLLRIMVVFHLYNFNVSTQHILNSVVSSWYHLNFLFLHFQVAITKAKVDFSSVVCLPPSVIAVNGLDGGGAGENDDEPVLVSLSAAPSPQSEAVANELQELSLQPELTLGLHPGRNPNLPPLSERKNGEIMWNYCIA